MKRLSIGLVASLALAIGLSSCGGSDTAPTSTPPPPAPSVVSVAVSGSAPQVGSSAQFTATASLSNGTTQAVTNQASWQSTDAGVASVSNSGLVSANASGTADILATYERVTGTARVTITAPTPTPSPGPSPPPGPPSPPPGSMQCTVSSPISASCGTATAVCNDNTYSCSQNRSGTCSQHDGVKCWICPGPLCNP